MSTAELGRYKLVENGSSLRIELGNGHRVLFTYPGAGEYDDVKSIGFGDCGCDLTVSENGKGLRYSVSKLSFGNTWGAAVAIADLSSGICRAGYEGCKGNGEVSLILLLGPEFSISSMARAGITSVEAITAVIQDLKLRDGQGRCGSGTGNLRMAIVSDKESELHLRGTGKHSKMGEIIGRTVYDAVLNSAIKNDVQRPFPVMAELHSRGYDEERIRSMLEMTVDEFEKVAHKMDDENVRACFSSISHLEDEIEWGLIPESTGNDIGRKMMESVLEVQTSKGENLLESFLFSLVDYRERSAFISHERRPTPSGTSPRPALRPDHRRHRLSVPRL